MKTTQLIAGLGLTAAAVVLVLFGGLDVDNAWTAIVAGAGGVSIGRTGKS